MAASIVQSAVANDDAYGGTSLTATFGTNITAGNCIFVCAMSYYGYTLTPSTGAGDSFTPVRSADAVGYGNSTMYSWIVTSALGGTSSVTITPQVSDYNFLAALEIAGLSSNPVDQTNFTGSQTTSPVSSGNVTTIQASEILIGYGGNSHDTTTTMTAGSGFTLIQVPTQGGGYNCFAVEYQIVSSTGTYSATCSISSMTVNTGFAIVTLHAPAAASGNSNQLMLMGCGT